MQDPLAARQAIAQLRTVLRQRCKATDVFTPLIGGWIWSSEAGLEELLLALWSLPRSWRTQPRRSTWVTRAWDDSSQSAM